MMRQAEVRISRKKQRIGSLAVYRVLVDGVDVGEIKNGKELSFKICEGNHDLSFVSFGKVQKIFNLTIQPENEPIHMELKINRATGKPEITSEDILIHCFDAGTSCPAHTVQKKKKTITCRTCGAEISPRAKRCPNCGEMTPGEVVGQTVVGCLFAPLILIGILISVGLYFGFFAGLLGH